MKKLSPIHILGILALILITAPIVYLLLQVFHEAEWVLKSNLLWTYVCNTLLMALVVGTMTGFMGIGFAWMVSFYDFPLRKAVRVLLALPLAIPPYIAAHAYADFTYSGGLLYRFLSFCGFPQYFDMMNLGGAIFVYSVTLYPYVYLICLSFFRHSGAALIDNARVLKAGPGKLFWKVGLPMARLPMVAGITLALMEMISDFGVVDYYGVQAFSTGIYKTWHNYNNFYGAIRLSAILLLIILGLVLSEAFMRRRLRYFTSSRGRFSKLIETNWKSRVMIYAIILPSLLLCFGLPLLQLLYNAHYVYRKLLNWQLLKVVGTTFYYSGLAALVCVVISFVIANFTSSSKNWLAGFIARLATMGYSVPGVIIGLAVIFSFIDVDKSLVPVYRWIGIESKVMVLSTSVFALIFAYIVRFLAISYNNIAAGYKKVNPNLFKASLTLKQSRTRTFWRVDLPLMLPTLGMAFLMVFLEIIKELPITLMLKPYHVETLTGQIYTYIHNEQYTEASVPSLVIIALGILAVSLTMIYKEKRYAKS